ncbi:MAG: hypothetical protein D6719_04095 [Candidatus Dadabacteria bacterium]|nr:MAG: hypothetical protein D6719_04095 [Candidatus Dadabacteria bacterium]
MVLPLLHLPLLPELQSALPACLVTLNLLLLLQNSLVAVTLNSIIFFRFQFTSTVKPAHRLTRDALMCASPFFICLDINAGRFQKRL